MEATGGFEPPNRGFADLRLSPLGYVAPLGCPSANSDPDCVLGYVAERYMVPRAGLEPTRAKAHGPLKTACLPIPPPRPDHVRSISQSGNPLSNAVKGDWQSAVSILRLS